MVERAPGASFGGGSGDTDIQSWANKLDNNQLMQAGKHILTKIASDPTLASQFRQEVGSDPTISRMLETQTT